MLFYSFFEVSQMNQTQNREIFSKEDLVSTYLSSEAVEDGFLFDLDLVVKQSSLGKFVLQYVTTNLLAKGYWNKDQTINIPNLRDLLEQSLRVFRKKPSDDYFVSGIIELPSGSKQKIFIAQNESGRYTVMLPEDY
jgi:hypothetical protein